MGEPEAPHSGVLRLPISVTRLSITNLGIKVTVRISRTLYITAQWGDTFVAKAYRTAS
jgi:hypothetical protein